MTLLILVSGLSFLGALGCSPKPGTMSGRGESASVATQALSARDLLSISGTYTECTRHTGDAWSLPISDGAALTHPLPMVVKNDAGCTLDLTSIVADQTYDVVPSLALASSYNRSASAAAAMTDGGPSLVAFYANAKITPADFSTDFLVTLLYSDDTRSISIQSQVTYGPP